MIAYLSLEMVRFSGTRLFETMWFQRTRHLEPVQCWGRDRGFEKAAALGSESNKYSPQRVGPLCMYQRQNYCGYPCSKEASNTRSVIEEAKGTGEGTGASSPWRRLPHRSCRSTPPPLKQSRGRDRIVSGTTRIVCAYLYLETVRVLGTGPLEPVRYRG